MEYKMKQINKAFHILKDKRQREIYDRQRRRSASSDVDLDFSDEDYEYCDSSDDEPGSSGAAMDQDIFANRFYKIFMRNLGGANSRQSSASPTLEEEMQERPRRAAHKSPYDRNGSSHRRGSSKK